MNTKLFALAFAQLLILNMVQSQCMNRILPGCGPNVLPIGETMLPNPLLYPQNYIGPNLMDYPYEILPNLPGQILPNVLSGQMLPNVLSGQVQLPSMLPGQILPNVLPGPVLPNVLQSPAIPAATTIIQDSTVANNLANALQLMVVSNLLANTLPQNEVLPNYPPIELLSPFGGFGGYNYIY